ncbi:hypothetical protein F5144DRAFT_587057 [Chaetomium tenue]|uniref:Uncharacterized protein n=1 Tax=Chaetomium tenue TaxID=1854479 RepID=A0ACB7NVD6_9PEZI|nr:hypothetical protein F5144DRAFT_587057 [Chaetomium globosum]
MAERLPQRAEAPAQRTVDDDNTYFGPGDAYHANNTPPPRPTLAADEIPATPTTEQPPPHTVSQNARALPPDRQQSAIRLRRLRGPALSSGLLPLNNVDQEPLGGRRRSSSEPQRPAIPTATAWTALPPVVEAQSHQIRDHVATPAPSPEPAAVVDGAPTHRRRHFPGRRRLTVQEPPYSHAQDRDCYDSRIVDILDVVDPEVATLSSITNIQNSLFIPSLGKWVNRRPTYDLSQVPRIPGAFPPSKEDVAAAESAGEGRPPEGARSPSLSSVLSDTQYAILPNDASLEGWPEEDIKALNDYVRHMLHSRRSKIKQRLKGFGKYARRPLGFLVTLYATLITLFGLAWVLFLIGWIYVGDRQLYAIDVIDYTLVALFGIVGDGLAPFRAVDTYHMIFVAHYHRKTWKLRSKLLLPDLQDHNDLPTGNKQDQSNQDPEAQPRSNEEQQDDQFVPVLSEKAQARLIHHQTKLAKSHTFYKPHETETHHAFPLRLLIAVVLLLDLHSCLQISLGICTWAVSAHLLPAAVTTTILCCSITTNILAGVLISIGDRRTRKQDVLERLLKQDLTGEVMKKMKKKKEKEKEAEMEDTKRGSENSKASLTAGPSIPARVKKECNGDEIRPSYNDPTSIHDYGSVREGEEPDNARLEIPGAFPLFEQGTRVE